MEESLSQRRQVTGGSFKLKFSDDEKKLFVLGYRGKEQFIHILDPRTVEPLKKELQVTTKGTVKDFIALNPSFTSLAVLHEKELVVYNVWHQDTIVCQWNLSFSARSIIKKDNNTLWITGDSNKVHQYDVKEKSQRILFETNTKRVWFTDVYKENNETFLLLVTEDCIEVWREEKNRKWELKYSVDLLADINKFDLVGKPRHEERRATTAIFMNQQEIAVGTSNSEVFVYNLMYADEKPSLYSDSSLLGRVKKIIVIVNNEQQFITSLIQSVVAIWHRGTHLLHRVVEHELYNFTDCTLLPRSGVLFCASKRKMVSDVEKDRRGVLYSEKPLVLTYPIPILGPIPDTFINCSQEVKLNQESNSFEDVSSSKPERDEVLCMASTSHGLGVSQRMSLDDDHNRNKRKRSASADSRILPQRKRN